MITIQDVRFARELPLRKQRNLFQELANDLGYTLTGNFCLDARYIRLLTKQRDEGYNTLTGKEKRFLLGERTVEDVEMMALANVARGLSREGKTPTEDNRMLKKKTKVLATPPEIIHVSLSMLKTHPKNARMHEEKNIAAIVASLQKFGQRSPLVINSKNEILKGNGTYEAMRRIGMQNVSAIQFPIDDEQAQLAYMIADNRASDLSQFKFETLSESVKSLESEFHDVIGFSEFEIRALTIDVAIDDAPSTSERIACINIKFTQEQWSTLMRLSGMTSNDAVSKSIVQRIIDSLERKLRKPVRKERIL